MKEELTERRVVVAYASQVEWWQECHCLNCDWRPEPTETYRDGRDACIEHATESGHEVLKKYESIVRYLPPMLGPELPPVEEGA